MANFEKIVKVTDAVLDCIPIVSSITNAAHLIYKLAHKVDASNPVAPGLKTSIKIHSLSKSNIDCFIGLLPVLGNIVKLVELVAGAICGFSRDDLDLAIILHNEEIIHLCLGNNALDDQGRADEALGQAAYSSSNEVFRQILNHRKDWSAKSLVRALSHCQYKGELNATDILDFWTAHGKVLDAIDTDYATMNIKSWLENGPIALAIRVIEILPKELSLQYTLDTLAKYSCAQYDWSSRVKDTPVLTAEQRDALIAKSTGLSLLQLQKHYSSLSSQLERNPSISIKNYLETHLDTLNKLINLAHLQPDESSALIDQTISAFIAQTIGESAFSESLIAKYEGQLTPQSKMQILQSLPLSPWNASRDFRKTREQLLASHEKRVQLFASWTDKWKNDVLGQAHTLYTDISRYVLTEGDCPSLENPQGVNAKFLQILLDTFPGCDQAPQKEAV